jgi:hypothetical protein
MEFEDKLIRVMLLTITVAMVSATVMLVYGAYRIITQ